MHAVSILPILVAATTASQNVTCADGLYMIVARGSDEPVGTGSSGLIAKGVAKKISGSHILGLDYPARSTEYEKSERQGAYAMHSAIVNYHKDCPDSRIALIGYSQGAQVASDVLCGGTGGSFNDIPPLSPLLAGSNIVASVHFGDPTHTSEASFNRGTSANNGMLPRVVTKCRPYAYRMVSYCDAGDPYCDNGKNYTAHESYIEKRKPADSIQLRGGLARYTEMAQPYDSALGLFETLALVPTFVARHIKMAVFSVFIVLIGFLAVHSVRAGDENEWLSPEYTSFFQFPLPIPPEIKPLETYVNSSAGSTIDFFQLNITDFEKHIYPGLGKATLVGYNGIAPGPTFRIKRGRQSVVRVVNEYDRPSVVHLHGSYTRPVWDGWAEDTIQPGQYKDYYYPNVNEARTMWYHDHAAGITAMNAYSGQAGFYIIEDPDVEARLGLPQGKYDIPLALAAKQYTDDGDLTSVADERESLYGDVIEVNGQPWPFLDVEPRKYRFRVLNTALSRTFVLSIVSESAVEKRGNGDDNDDGDDDDDDNENNDDNASNQVPFIVVASDSGFMSSSVTTSKLAVAMAERWEIIVDFSDFAGQNLTMKNDREVFTDDDFAGTDRVMQFNVGSKVSSNANNGPVPLSLVSLDMPKAGTKIDRTFKFEKDDDTYLINGREMESPSQSTLPVDLSAACRKGLEPYEKAALKDVAVLGPDERVTVAIKFAPMEGLYMFHCHNLVHEDHDMMAAFNITSLQGLGYHESDLAFSDPMDKNWRAKSFKDVDDQSVKYELLPQFAATEAYQNITGLDKALDQYWAVHTDESDDESVASSHRLLLSPWSMLLLYAIWFYY
ncbi:hypothetical protein NM208_g3587 [Fusarium decemcellulare]|uniref:Uncharacterized protein n=1 Tax=Fusarium decemcellulare TaxID=57161 RepID=A0ACC1SNM9_9HYPO|nr:hypothetical protein NM208_g3587 [Fusarium decemcellulare]